MIKKILVHCMFLLLIQVSYSQVGIGTTTPHHSSALDISSTNKGFLPPRMNINERNDILTPAKGLIIYNLDDHCLNFYNGSTWINPCLGATVVSVPDPLPPNIVLSANQTKYIVSAYDEDYLPYETATAVATTGTINANNSTSEENKTLNIQGVLNTTSGIEVLIPYVVSGSNVTLPKYSQTKTIVSAHVQGSVVLSTNGGGTAVDVTFSYDAVTLNVGAGVITATIKAVGSDYNAVKLDLNAGLGTDIGILLAEFTMAINDAGDLETIKLKDIPGIPDRNLADANHIFIYSPVVAKDGRTWLNNNLGANYSNANHNLFNPNQQAINRADLNALGSLFQWGRYSDGHELINHYSSHIRQGINESTTTKSTTTTPIHGLFIRTADPFLNRDWLTFSTSLLWQGVSGPNNPCPQDYRLPTETEMNTLVASENITRISTAFGSTLALTAQGFRLANGAFDNVGRIGHQPLNGGYWTSSTDSGLSRIFKTDNLTFRTIFIDQARNSGHGIRCIKE